MGHVVEIFHDFRLCVAHSLPLVPPEHKCHGLHGHNYKVTLRIRGETGPLGWVTDYACVAREWKRLVHDELDHTNLNDALGDQSTSEMLCVWIWHRIKPIFRGLCEVTCREVDDAGSTYRGPE